MAFNASNEAPKVPKLNATQEHFFKKYLVEHRLAEELRYMSKRDCCGYLGPPFRVNNDQKNTNPVPMLRFFFQNYVKTFPFIMMCSLEEQRAFWQDTVQPFVESLNLKQLSDSGERAENVTKRRQVNKKLLSGLVLFFNSVLTSENDMKYLTSTHEKSGTTSRLQKLEKPKKFNVKELRADSLATKLHDYEKLTYFNDLSVNVIAVRELATTNQKSRFNVTSYFNNAPRHHFEFILQIVHRQGSGYKCHFVAHPHHDFKTLMKSLRKNYPGLISTEFPELPRKLQHDDGVPVKQIKEIDAHGLPDIVLFREKLRLALRGYMMRLINYPEIVHSSEFRAFISSNSFPTLDPPMEWDYKIRCQNETNMFNTQLEFQRQSAKVMGEFQAKFELFKQQLIMTPNTLTKLFEEFGSVEKVEDLSPMTFTFVRWCKLELAALNYQIFLSLDNASEWLAKCRKFHAMFPYSIVYGILRFTNPMKMMARIIDLLLINIPSLSLSMPFSGKKDLTEASKSTGAKNLLSLMFVMLLDEDLNDFLAEVEELRKSVPKEYHILLSRVDNYVMADSDKIDKIKEESVQQDEDLLLTILHTDRIGPKLQLSHKEIYDHISDSYWHFAKISGNTNIEEAKLYLKIKQYWLIQLRRKDKDIMKELWREPEMTQLIKKFVTIFYSPFVRVLGKADVHVMFRQWEKFVDENLDVLTELSNGGIYFMSSMEIFNRLLAVLDKHENFFYGVVHNLYINDDEHVFRGLAQWIEKFLTALRIKFVDHSLVNIDMLNLQASEPVSEEKLQLQIDSIVERTVEKRKLYKEYLQKKSELKFSNASDQDKLNDMWEKNNENIFGEGQANDFGLDQDDLNDFNLMQEVENVSADDATAELDRQLYKKLQELDERTLGATDAVEAYEESFGLRVAEILDKLESSRFFEERRGRL